MSDFLNEELFPGNIAAYEELRKVLDAGSAVALVGAGASAPLYPTWVPLLQKLLQQARTKGLISSARDYEEIEAQISKDPLEAAGFIEDLYGKQVFRSAFAEVFRINNDKFTSAQEAIVEAGFGGIVTTNYDEGLENAYSHVHHKTLNAIRMDDTAELTRWVQKTSFGDMRKPLVHLHGVTNQPSSMVLTADDYNAHYAMQDRRTFIEQLWRSDRLLSIGFGFSDPFLTRIAESVLRSIESDTRHFGIIGYKTAEQISTILRKSFVRKYRLSPIFYQVREGADGHGEDHSDLLCILQGLIPNGTSKSGMNGGEAVPSSQVPSVVSETPTQMFERDFFANLLNTSHNKTLYVEPRVYVSEVASGGEAGVNYTQINNSDLWSGSKSYLIYCGSEYGGSTLCRRIALETSRLGQYVTLRDARSLPNYRKRLVAEFADVPAASGDKTIVIDNFNVQKDERMLNEIRELGIFTKIIVCVTKYDGVEDTVNSSSSYAEHFSIVQVLGLDRSDIRVLSRDLFDSHDEGFVTTIVDKVYDDLLQLCIPLTPLNVIMYLQILHKEGDFVPLNRVQILDRYVHQLLRKPSDDYQYTLNARGRIEVVSGFIYELFINDQTSCTELDWYNYCKKYKKESLNDFDENALLDDLLGQKVLIKLGRNIMFRYRLFYSYFLGKYIANRDAELTRFLATDHHISTEGLVEVISNFSSDNNRLLEDLISKLEDAVGKFHATYVPADADPFKEIEWKPDAGDDEAIWNPLMRSIESGPKSSGELDRLKSSWLAEIRTEDQAVTIKRFNELEQKLVEYHYALVDALVCTETVSGSVKVRAVMALYKGWNVLFQVGLLHAPVIARNRYFVWNGVLFSNEMKFDDEMSSRERTGMIFIGTIKAITDVATNRIGSKKLGEVFKFITKNHELSGFLRLLNYSLVLRSKPGDWAEVVQGIIRDTDRNTFYMRSMLNHAYWQYMNHVNSNVDKDRLKRVVALIRARRDMKTNNPSSSLVNKVMSAIEESFEPSERAADRPAR